MRWLAGLFALVLVLAAGQGAAQAPPRRVALVIANAAYANALINPPNDARLVSGALQRAGFQTIQLKSNLPALAMRAALREFRQQAAGAQVALIYYAGHGIEANGKNWLIPTDAALNSELDLVDEAIDLDRVLADVSGADLRVVILDACRDNPFGRSWRRGTRAFTRGLGPVDADDVLVIFAAAPGQQAADGAGGNSPFATALARRLPETGLPIQLLGNVVRDDVLRATANGQRPFVSASMTGQVFTLVPAASAAPPPPDPEIERLRRQNADLLERINRQSQPAPPATQPSAPPASQPVVAVRPPAPSSTPAPAAPQTFRDCAGCPEMVVIPAGAFLMGSPESEQGRDSDEGPQRRVEIARFAAGKFEVTFDEWAACAASGGCRSNPNLSDQGWGRGRRPVINVSWDDAQEYIAWLNAKTGQRYRLLTEAEWEYAARAGTATRWSFGDDESQLGTHAWFDGNSGGRTQPVGGKTANRFGLHDVHGNVWEWVEDCWASNYSGLATNGSANTTQSCSHRVIRGGGWYLFAQGLRSALRGGDAPTVRVSSLGFRLARTL